MYRRDKSIPSHGRRAKADNAGTVRVRISRWPIGLIGPSGFDFYLNINPASQTYNATAESVLNFSGKKVSTAVEVKSEVLERIVRLAQDWNFMYIKNADIFPETEILDGDDIKISIKTDDGNLFLNNSLLNHTLHDGRIPTATMTFITPFHLLAKLAYKALDANPFLGLSAMID